MVQQAEARTQPLGLVETVRRQDDRFALLPQESDVLRDDLAAEHVQAEGGLVEQQHRRPVDEGAGQVDALPLASAQGAAAAVEQFGQAEQTGEVLQFGAGRVGRHGVEVGEEQQHFADAEGLVEAGVGGDQADAALDLIGMVGGVEAGDCRPSAAGRQQAEDHADGGGFAGAVGTEQTVDLAGRDGERQVRDGNDLVAAGQREALGQVLNMNHRRTPGSAFDVMASGAALARRGSTASGAASARRCFAVPAG